MDIFSVLTLIGGLCLFLFGMNVMSGGLERVGGNRMESILEKLTSNRFAAVAVGAGITAVIQSSSATTVMVVGFVNSGIMKLSQAIGLIMGANIGTTVTAWLLSLTSIDGSGILLQFCKPSSFTPILAVIGIILYMTGKNSSKKDIGEILLGFAVLMGGMETMSAAVEPLKDMPEFTQLLTVFDNPFMGIVVGAVVTGIIQSSSASVGILQALSVTGAFTYGSVIPIIMGQNIGTCVTALISAIGAKKNAKRTAFVHLYFNLIGTIVFMILFYLINAVAGFAFLNDAATASGIAVVHTTFNVLATLFWLPFHNLLVKLACLTVRDKAEEEHSRAAESAEALKGLDERFLNNPGFAMNKCREACAKMGEVTTEALNAAIELLDTFDEKKLQITSEDETIVDQYEDTLGTYLVQLSGNELQARDSHTLSVMLHSIGDIERISDHAIAIGNAAKEIFDKNLAFSEAAVSELKVFSAAVQEIVRLTMEAMKTEDIALAQSVEPLEELIDDIGDTMKQRHIDRLREGRCTIELGFILSDLTTSYKRIADHCSNIAVCLIQADNNEYGRHEYLHSLDNDQYFRDKFHEYKKRFALPERVKGTPMIDARTRMQ